MENVLPHRDIQEQFHDISTQWGIDPIVDAADGQVTSRPRLWWLDADWKYVSHQLTGSTPFTLHWTLQDGHHKLHNPIASMIQPSVHVKDWETPAVLCNKHLFHCLTTQAPTDLGRPPPAHAQADDATWERWQQDNRQFPPWQYQPQFLTRPHEGEWQSITPLQRERLMALPDDYTKITDRHPSTRTRNTMLGNAWHFPSALWLLTLLLMIPSSPALGHSPTQSNLQKLTGLWLASQTPWPPAKTTHHQHMPQLDWHSHLRWARTLQDPTADHSNLDPSLCWAINQSRCLPNIQQIRQAVTTELRLLVEEHQENTTSWFEQIPPHCQLAYQQTDMITQIPTLIHILDSIQYPHTQHSNRNSVKDSPYWDIYTQAWIGMSAPTPNTHLPPPSRHYDNITEPTSTRNYSRTKSTHTGISWRTKSPQKSNKDVWLAPSKHQHGCRPTLHHWKNTHTLPFYYLFLTQIPLSQWPSASNRPDQMENRRSDAERTGDPLAITKHVTWQTNLITILQITTHGWHNIPDNDPTNHHWCGAMITTVHIDNYLLTILPSPMSCCLPQMAQPYGTIMYSFGSAASVWAYNRFGDMLSAVARTIACIPVVHYVDDYGAIEPTGSAESGFDTFESINSILGFHMKISKKQPPRSHTGYKESP